MWILLKMRTWYGEFCQKWDFQNVNSVKNEPLKMWILSKMRLWRCEFSDCVLQGILLIIIVVYFSRSIGLIYILLSALVIYWFGTLVSFLALLAWQTTFFSLPSALVIETRWTWNILTCTRWVGMKSDAHWAFCAFYIAFQPNDTLHCNFCACPEALEWKLQKRIPIDQIGTAWFLVSSETKLSRIFPDSRA